MKIRKTQSGVSVPADTQMKHILNTSQKWYYLGQLAQGGETT
jgi:hypothetical protein